MSEVEFGEYFILVIGPATDLYDIGNDKPRLPGWVLLQVREYQKVTRLYNLACSFVVDFQRAPRRKENCVSRGKCRQETCYVVADAKRLE